MADEYSYLDLGYTRLLEKGDDLFDIDISLEEATSDSTVSMSTDSSSVTESETSEYNGDTDSVEDVTAISTVSSGEVSSQWTIATDGYIIGGATAYNTGTGFFLGWDSTAYKFSIGDSSSNYLTWDGTTLSISGTITIITGTIAGLTISATDLTATSGGNTTIVSSGATAFTAGPTGSPTFTVTQAGLLTTTSALIGGWNVVDGYIYNLQSGTPTASPNDGVVLASGNEALIIYEDAAIRVQVGYLSAGVYGIVGYATDGSTKIFEMSDTQQMVAGWVFDNIYMYGLASGTPTAAPNDGIVLTSGSTGSVLIYEDTAIRVRIGYLSAGIYGILGYATDGTTKIFEMSDTQQFVGGWTFTDASLYNLVTGTPTAAPNDGLVLTANATPAVIAYEDTAKRAELGYLSAGVFGLKVYATNGTTVIFEASDTQQIMAGWTFTDTALYNLASGTPTAAPNDGSVILANSTPAFIVYEDTAKRVEMGYLSAGVFGFKGYATDGTTVIFEMSDTQQRVGGWYFTDIVLRSATTDATSNILIDSANGLIRAGVTTGDYITLDGANLRLRSSNYVSGALGAGFTLEPDLFEVGNASIRGQLQMATFVANSISAVNGDLAVVLGADTLNADMTALDASTITITGDTTFAVNDIIRIKEGVNDEWMLVTNIASAPTYTVTRDQAGAYGADANPAWTIGATVVNFGPSGSGGLFLTASDTNAPFISVFTHAGTPYTTLTTRARLGNLNGYLGYVTDIYGLGVGSTSAGEANITIEPTNGIRIRSGTTLLFQVDMAGSATIGGWVLGATSFTDAAGVVGLSSAVTGGDDIRIWAGDATPASAEFRVTEAGALVATSATITGAITASSGSITGAFSVLAGLTVGTAGTFSSGQTAYDTGTGWWMEYNGGTPRMSFGNASGGNFTWDGTTFAVDGVAIDGTSTANGSTVENVQTRAEALFTEEFMYVGRPDDSDTALTEFMTATAGGGGTITRRLMMTSIQGGAASQSYLVGASVMAELDGATIQWQDKDLLFYVNAEFGTNVTQDAFLGYFARTLFPAVDATDTVRHIGFYFQDGIIYASNANGTTQTRTDVSTGITMTNMNLYWFKWDAGTNITFYINDTLVATHSTNLPTTSDGVPLLQIAGDGTAARRLDIKNNYTFVMTT